MAFLPSSFEDRLTRLLDFEYPNTVPLSCPAMGRSESKADIIFRHGNVDFGFSSGILATLRIVTDQCLEMLSP